MPFDGFTIVGAVHEQPLCVLSEPWWASLLDFSFIQYLK